jgi:hypothetical protein
VRCQIVLYRYQVFFGSQRFDNVEQAQRNRGVIAAPFQHGGERAGHLGLDRDPDAGDGFTNGDGVGGGAQGGVGEAGNEQPFVHEQNGQIPESGRGLRAAQAVERGRAESVQIVQQQSLKSGFAGVVVFREFVQNGPDITGITLHQVGGGLRHDAPLCDVLSAGA